MDRETILCGILMGSGRQHPDAGEEVTGPATAFDNWRYWNSIKSANVTIDRGVAEEAVMRTIPFVLITFVALSLSTSAARADANGSWCANYGTGQDRKSTRLNS